jgi:hypothetical protein
VALTRIKTTPQSGEHGEHHTEPLTAASFRG